MRLPEEWRQSTRQFWSRVQSTSGDQERGLQMLRRGRGKPRPFKQRMVAENDAMVGTYVTAPEAFAAIRQRGQKTRNGQWRYTLRPVKPETANS
jgi:hypothetical protein